MALTTDNNVEFAGYPGHPPGVLHARPGSGTVTLQVGVVLGGSMTWRDFEQYSADADVVVELSHMNYRVVLTGDAAYEFKT